MACTSELAVHRLVGTNRIVVLNTGNKSEIATGYFTLYGDGIGAVSILGDCLKSRVFNIANELDDAVIQAIKNRVPTAELRPNQTDETSLIQYVQLDAILSILIESQRTEDTIEQDLKRFLKDSNLICAQFVLPRIIKLFCNYGFKRQQLPFSIKVSPFALDKN